MNAVVSGVILSIAVFAADSKAMTVSDPKNLMPTLAGYFQASSFATTMACPQTASFEAIDARCSLRCTDVFCMSRCDTARDFEKRFDVHIDECSDDKFNIFSDTGLRIEVSQQDFVDSGSTWLLPLLKGFGFYLQPDLGDIELTGVKSESVKLIEAGRIRTISAVVVDADIVQGVGLSRHRMWVMLTPDLDGVRQIVAFAIGDKSYSDPLYKLRGLVLPKITH